MATAAPTTSPANPNAFLESILPGVGNMTSTATGNIEQLLSGLPSVSATRQSNAYFGAASGMPGSDFVRNRGFDLYGQQAAANREMGLQDLLKTIGSYSSPALQEQGQQLQNTQFGQTFGLDQQKLAQQNSQFGSDLALQQQAQAWKEKQGSADYLQMLQNLQRYGTTTAPTNPVTGQPLRGGDVWTTFPNGNVSSGYGGQPPGQQPNTWSPPNQDSVDLMSMINFMG